MESAVLWFCNWSTLGVCAALKLPQIHAQLVARSARGISLPSLLLELAGLSLLKPGPADRKLPSWHSDTLPQQKFVWLQRGFLVFLRYQCYYGSPLLTYLEYPILIVQDAILLLCVFHFNGNMRQAGPYAAVFVSSWFVLGLQKWLIDLAMYLCTFISAASKFVQLRHLWETQDSGAVSALTWGLSAYTCAARIITTLMTTTDFAILMRFVIMLALNIWVTLTVLQYQKAGSKDK